MKALTAPLLMTLFVSTAFAQTTATDPWVRGTVAQQKASGLFVQLTSAQGGRLVSASSSMASSAEIHEMAMDGNIMTMRALPDGLALPAGKAVALKPGGVHIMLMGLKQALQAGDTVPVTLVIEGADKKRETVAIKALVRAPGATAPEHKH